MRRLALLAALPRELKPLTGSWKRLPAPKNVWLWHHVDQEGDEIVAACAGMGPNAARRAFAAAETVGILDLVLSVGLAGATTPTLAVGSVHGVAEVVDVQTGERFILAESGRGLRLATVPQPAHAVEKERLAATYGALLVDMEAATIARLAQMRGVPMGCVKAISDAADAALPDLGPFVDHEGQLDTARFVMHLLARPGSWRSIAGLARNSQLAARALGTALTEFLAHKDWDFTGRTGFFEKPSAP